MPISTNVHLLEAPNRKISKMHFRQFIIVKDKQNTSMHTFQGTQTRSTKGAN